MKMPIPFEVIYRKIGNKKERHVIGVITPTVLNQAIGKYKAKPIFIDMGDIKTNWKETSPGFEMLSLKGGFDGF